MHSWRQQFSHRKSLTVNEEVAFMMWENCTNILVPENLGKIVYNIRCKWESQMRKMAQEVEQETVVLL
jgi:hypothetical protein